MIYDGLTKEGVIFVPKAGGGTIEATREHHIPIFEALKGMALDTHGEESDFAVGTRLGNGGAETIYVEHKQGSQIARVEVATGKVRASVANPAMGMAVKKVKELAEIAAAIWYVYIAYDFDNTYGSASGKAKTVEKDLQSLLDRIYNGIEDDELADFELDLNDFEAKALSWNGPLNGSEKSVPVLDKKMAGPTKIISGTFETFPGTAKKPVATDRKYTIEKLKEIVEKGMTPAMREHAANLTEDQKAYLVSPMDDYVPGKIIFWMARRVFDTLGKRGREVHAIGLFGPAGSGKTEVKRKLAELTGEPDYSHVFHKNFSMDDMREQQIPFIAHTIDPATLNLSPEEAAVNAALKADKTGRAPELIAWEALDYPSREEVMLMPELAEDILGPDYAGEEPHKLYAELQLRIQNVLLSLKRTLENSGVGRDYLGFRAYFPPYLKWFIGGGWLECAETSTANQAELAGLHEDFDFSKDVYKDIPSLGLVKRNPFCFVVLTNNLDGNENQEMSSPLLSRMQVPLYVDAPSVQETTDRLCKVLDCKSQRQKVKEVVEAFMAVADIAKKKELPAELDFRRLKEITGEIVCDEYDPREVFEMEVMTHFKIYSEQYCRHEDEQAMLSVLDELELFR